MIFDPEPDRYDRMLYRRCGRSGLKLPVISLGLWHNFGGVDTLENARAMICRAFDLGITHFDLANNYGPPPGSAEETFGKILHTDLSRHRDELIIATKAGYTMWPGPYGDWGSRKYLAASLDQSLKRMGLDYVDIFYSHRPDPETPLEETMSALDHMVRSGKALYTGISSYDPDLTRRAATILRELGTPCLIHQPSYSMFNRWIEKGLLQVLQEEGIGVHRLFAACSGSSDKSVRERHSRGFARGETTRFPATRKHYRGKAVQDQKAAGNCRVAVAVAGADGSGLGVASSGDDLSAHRRQQGLPNRRNGRGTAESAFCRGRIERHRAGARIAGGRQRLSNG